MEQPTSRPILSDKIILEPKEVIRYLGIWFDRRLNFKIHGDKRLHLATGALRMIRNLASATRGLHCHAPRQLYLAIIIGAYKRSPTKALEVEASILPVKVRYQK